LSAKDDKIKRQALEISKLTSKLKEKEKEVTRLSSSLANLADRIRILEEADRSRRQRDAFADQKKLAAKGTVLCNECLPPSAFIYKKPLIASTNPHHGHEFVDCSNCKVVRLYLKAGDFVPIFSFNNSSRNFFMYPEGFSLKSQVVTEARVVYRNLFAQYSGRFKTKDDLYAFFGFDERSVSVQATASMLKMLKDTVPQSIFSEIWDDYVMNRILTCYDVVDTALFTNLILRETASNV